MKCYGSTWFVGLFAYMAMLPGSALQADEPLASRLRQQLEKMPCPGAVLGVYRADGTAVHEFALGVAEHNTKKPIQLDMHFRIASLTKLFVGTSILRLVDAGKLQLTDPVNKYLKDIPNGDLITIRMLGNNTSGLPNAIENKNFQQAIIAEPNRVWRHEEILAYALELPPTGSPEQKFRYSNTNALLLGMILEKVTGKPYATVVQEQVLTPLQLTQTGFSTDGSLPVPHPRSYRHGYPDKVIGYGKVWYDVTEYSASWTGPAGEMYGTLADLGRAIPALATGSLLSAAGKAELQRWVKTGYDGIEYGFCLGQRKGALGHTGDVPGYNAVAYFLPEQQLTLVVLANLSNNPDGTMPAEALAETIRQTLIPVHGQ